MFINFFAPDACRTWRNRMPTQSHSWVPPLWRTPISIPCLF